MDCTAKIALLISGVSPPPDNDAELLFYDTLFYETDWYQNQFHEILTRHGRA